MEEKIVETICCFCNANCGMKVHLKKGRIVRVDGNTNHPINRGNICVKGRAAVQLVYSPDRLKHPLLKVDGSYKRISWDEAFNIISEKLKEIEERYGPEALVLCKGARTCEEHVDGFEQFMALYGSPNIAGVGHLCSVPRAIASASVYGGRTEPDYEHTKCIVVWGANPLETMRPGYSSAYEDFVKVYMKAKKRGAIIIVIDPKRIDLGVEIDEWVPIKPGTDAAFGLAMLNVILEEGLYDRNFVGNWTIGFEQLKKHVRRYTPEEAEKITWISASQIRDVARDYATIKPALIYEANGLDMHTNVVDTVRVICTLRAITGNLDVPGGDVFYPSVPKSTYPTRAFEKQKQLGAGKYPLFPNAPFPVIVDAILTGKPYQPKAMIVYQANPALTMGNSNRVRKALEELEFLVVHDLFMTATAELADVVLPAASSFERVGYRAYLSDKGEFVALRQKVVEPIGDCRSVFEVEYELAKKMGFHVNYPWRTAEEWISYKLLPASISYEDLEKQPIIYVTSPMEYRKYEKMGFNTPSGKVELYSDKFRRLGYSPIPVHREPEEFFIDRQDIVLNYPLIGTTRKPYEYAHTKFRNLPMLHKIYPEPILWMNPDDAKVRKIEDGTTTSLTSPRGSFNIKTKITATVRSGVLVVDYGWGNPWDGKPNVNILTSDEYRDPVACATPNRLFLCDVQRL